MSTTLNYIHDAGYPFQVAATRYIPKDAAEDGLTLILAHANRLHKEPCGILAQSLIELSQNNGRNRSLSIRDIWSIESPIHGETEGPDRGDVGVRHDNEGSDWEYSRAVLSFLDSQPDGVNFYERDIVAIGHGQGGNTLALLHALKPRLPIISFVLLNPDIDSSSAPARAYEYAAPRVMDYQPRVVDVLHKLYARGPPVHLVLSAADDIRQDVLLRPDPISKRKCYSVQWIETEERTPIPEVPAKAIYDALLMITCQTPCRHDVNPIIAQVKMEHTQARL